MIGLQNLLQERNSMNCQQEFEYTDGMTVAEIAKTMYQEALNQLKSLKLFMVECPWPHKTNLLDGETEVIELLARWITVWPNKRLKWIMPTSNVSLSKIIYLNEDEWLSVHQLA